MDRPTVSAAAREAYDRIASALEPTGSTAGKMMGMPTLYASGKAFAGLYGDAMTFKLAEPDHAAALALQGAVLFDPSGMGRPMRAWVQVPSEHAAEWRRLAEAALENGRGQA